LTAHWSVALLMQQRSFLVVKWLQVVTYTRTALVVEDKQPVGANSFPSLSQRKLDSLQGEFKHGFTVQVIHPRFFFCLIQMLY
jgi:hypothetical protein